MRSIKILYTKHKIKSKPSRDVEKYNRKGTLLFFLRKEYGVLCAEYKSSSFTSIIIPVLWSCKRNKIPRWPKIEGIQWWVILVKLNYYIFIVLFHILSLRGSVKQKRTVPDKKCIKNETFKIVEKYNVKFIFIDLSKRI